MQKYLVAQLLAEGLSISEILEHPEVKIRTVHAWFLHPGFKQYVQEITIEIGLANKQIRIAKYNRLAAKMFNKIDKALDEIDENDKNIVPFINAFCELTKLIAQEKEEFVK